MLKVEALSYEIKRNKFLVHNISLSLASKQILGIIGPSGAGKSTLLHLISGLISPTCGRITLDTEDITRKSVSERPISYLQQSFPLYEHMTVIENVLVAYESLGGPYRKSKKVEIGSTLNKLGISEFLWNRRPSGLSGGETQRIALAKAMLKPCKLLLLDEPFSNIDKGARRNLAEAVKKLVNDNSLCACYISHDEHDVLLVSTHIAIMHEGKLIQTDELKNVISRPKSIQAASVGSMLGIQKIRINKLKSKEIRDKLKERAPKEAIFFAWRAESAKLYAPSNLNEVENDSINVPVKIIGIKEIGENNYYTLEAIASENNVNIYHVQNLSDLKSIYLNDVAFLRMSSKDILFLDSSDRILNYE